MRHGSRPGPDKLVAWATYIEEPIEDWFRYAGYDRLIDAPVARTPAPTRPPIPRGMPEPGEESQEAEPGDEITREIDLDAIGAHGYTNGEMSEESRSELAEIAKLLIERDRAEAWLQLKIDAVKRAAKRKPEGE